MCDRCGHVIGAMSCETIGVFEGSCPVCDHTISIEFVTEERGEGYSFQFIINTGEED